jgi:hypothetical protein
MNPARVIIAFGVAPLMTPIVLLGVARGDGPPFSLKRDLALFVFVAGFAYVATALFGVPAFFLFRTKRWTNVFLYVFVGGLIGLAVSVVINQRVSFSFWDQEFRLRCMLAAALSALVFRMLSGVNFNQKSSTPTAADL